MSNIELFEKPEIDKLKKLTRELISEIAINFSTNIPIEERIVIVYNLKKLIEDIEKIDKEVYQRFLREYYSKNKNNSNPPQIGDYQVVEKSITKKVYTNQSEAEKLQNQIDELKKKLEQLEHYEQTIKKIYYIKFKSDKES